MKQLVLIVGAILFTYLNIIFSNIQLNQNLFSNLNLIQILTPIMQLFTALLLAYYVNISIAKRNKSVDLLIDILDKYLEELSEINELTIKYIKDKDVSDANSILWKFKKLSMSHQKIEMLYSLYSNQKFVYLIEEMKEDLFELKKSITNDPFKQNNNYTSKQKVEILKNFVKIESNIYKEKKNLYG